MSYIIIDESGFEHTDKIKNMKKSQELRKEHEEIYNSTFYIKEVE